MQEDVDIKAYLIAFERQMNDLEYIMVSALLSDWANVEIEVIQERDRGSYKKTKEILLNAYADASCPGHAPHAPHAPCLPGPQQLHSF